MSGYLQRMVSGALNSGASGTRDSAIHPVLGSIFSAPRSESMDGPPPEEVNIFGQPEVKSSGETLTPAPVRHPQAEPQVPSILPVELRRLMPEKEVQIEPTTVRPPQARPTADQPREATESAQGRETNQPVEFVFAARDKAIVDGVYRPLVDGDFPRPIPPEVLRGRMSGAATSEKKASRPAERERDEIQIHIGRIEVTAVPQAPARPAARPARKTLSLDEYLKRGDRRV